MTLRKREKIWTVGLALSLVVFAIDRVLGPAAEPDSAAAALGDVPLPPPLPDAPSPTTPSATSEPDAVADVFSWERLVSDPESAKPVDAAANEVAARLGEFRTTHQLRATILGPHPAALIDDRTVAVGERIGEFVLESVQRDFVVFLLDDQRVELRLPAPGAKP